MFTLVSATAHWPRNEGMRCVSSTVALSAIAVMSAFQVPSSELAAAASGRASRSCCAASFWSSATVAGGVPGTEERSQSRTD